jgi:hypothetical protein
LDPTAPPNRAVKRFVGFEFLHDGPGEWYVGVPYWALLIALAITPAVWMLTRRRLRTAARMNLCRSCGYDLRASPERCPECGTPAKDVSDFA